MRVRPVVAAGALLLLALFSTPATANDDHVIEVALGGSTVVRINMAAARKVTLTDPSVAEIQTAAGGLLVIGRKVGETNLVLHSDGGAQKLLIKVTLPAQAIQGELARMFPREDIEARAVGGSLVLVGAVSSTPVVQQAEQVAMGYLRSPSIAALGVEPHVINLLRVRDRQQVQLEVKFAEVNRRSLRQMGVNFAGRSEGGRVGAIVGEGANGVTDARVRADVLSTGGNADNALTTTASGGPQPLEVVRREGAFPANAGTIGSIFVGLNDGPFPFAATLSALAQRDLSKTLAEPTLVAMSGQSADFLVGGEVAIPISTGLGTVSVQFKKFGILLDFTPTVLADATVQIDTKMEVSAPDDRFGVTINNILTPGFKTRRSQTTVRMRDGQSFAIAGLLTDEMENSLKKVPGFGDIPILGILFSSKDFERNETELVVVVTVKLVDPMDAGVIPKLPGDDVGDATDVQLFLLHLPWPKAPASQTQGLRRRTGAGDGGMMRRPSGSVGFWR